MNHGPWQELHAWKQCDACTQRATWIRSVLRPDARIIAFDHKCTECRDLPPTCSSSFKSEA